MEKDFKSACIVKRNCYVGKGDHPCDFTLIDQHGNEFILYDHIGKYIILDLSAMWCGPCQFAATEVEELQQKYGDDVVYVTILIENQSGNPPTKNNVKDWADIFGIETAPVLGGSRNLISGDVNVGWPLEAWPQFHIIDRNMVLIDSFKGSRAGRMESKIKELLAEDG